MELKTIEKTLLFILLALIIKCYGQNRGIETIILNAPRTSTIWKVENSNKCKFIVSVFLRFTISISYFLQVGKILAGMLRVQEVKRERREREREEKMRGKWKVGGIGGNTRKRNTFQLLLYWES